MNELPLNQIVRADALEFMKTLPDQSVNCVVTSPPYYGLRDYGVSGQLGLEASPRAYVDAMCAVFSEVRRVLRDDGVLFLNIGDSYSGSGKGPGGKVAYMGDSIGKKIDLDMPNKCLLGVPWRLAFALVDDGYILRSDIIWSKPNPMPESVTDRPTKAHEYVFLFSKSGRYWYDQEAVREEGHDWGHTYKTNPKYGNPGSGLNPHSGLHDRDYSEKGRNARSVWTIATEPTPFAHFATMPQALVERCILAGCPKGGVVLDPFMGSGTTALVARRIDRHYIGCDLNPDYVALAQKRLRDTDPYQHRDMPNGTKQLSMFSE